MQWLCRADDSYISDHCKPQPSRVCPIVPGSSSTMISRSGTHSSPNHLIHPSWWSASCYHSKCVECAFNAFNFHEIWKLVNFKTYLQAYLSKTFLIIFIFSTNPYKTKLQHLRFSYSFQLTPLSILYSGSIEVVADDRSDQVIKSCKSAVWNKHVEHVEVK